VEAHHLAQAWLATCRAVGAIEEVADVGAELLAAYAEPQRRYHDLAHLTDVLTHVDELAGEAADPDAVRLAAWFHDAVYDPTSPDNEERSALLAERALVALRVPEATAIEVARLVRLTAGHDPRPGDRNGAVLCDADLAVLGREPEAYRSYTQAVRQEYALVPDHAFRAGREAILRDLLERPQLFRTAAGIDRWEAPARANLQAELGTLG
jgi:predicted metal-dependent HD superfamily phosphohydrolase